MGLPPNGWLKKKNPIKVDDLGVPIFFLWFPTTCGPWNPAVFPCQVSFVVLGLREILTKHHEFYQ